MTYRMSGEDALIHLPDEGEDEDEDLHQPHHHQEAVEDVPFFQGIIKIKKSGHVNEVFGFSFLVFRRVRLAHHIMVQGAASATCPGPPFSALNQLPPVKPCGPAQKQQVFQHRRRPHLPLRKQAAAAVNLQPPGHGDQDDDQEAGHQSRQDKQAAARFKPHYQTQPRHDLHPGQPRHRHPHQALRQQLVSQHGFGKFIGVQDFLQPGIKKKPA